MKRWIIVAALLILFGGTIGDGYAFTYTYNNGTGYPVKVTAQLYDDADNPDLHSSGDRGGSEEPIAEHPVRTQAYSEVRRGERRSDNEGIHLKANRDQTGELEANGSYVISSKFLLKSWTADVFLDNKWEQVLNMTCDLLPGNHTFSIYFDEKKDPGGTVTRTWNALIK